MNPARLIGGRFELQEIIGRGGMGTVYRGHDRQNNETVAIKQLKPEVVAEDASQTERFNREGEALRQLNHPNIVKMLTAVVEAGDHYLVMEYVAGGSLRDLLDKQKPLPVLRLLEIGLDLADALTRAHRLGIIHRDIKPGNVLLAEDGTPRLTDFGVAHLAGRERLTEVGTLAGTYAYLSPESFLGQPPDARADIWAFGVLLYEMLTGRLPFSERQVGALILAISANEAPSPALLRPDAPPALVELIQAMLVKEPAQRVSSVRLVGAELEEILRTATGAAPARHAGRTSGAGPTRFTASTAGAWDQVATTSRHNLPNLATAFVGRGPELSAINGRLSQADCRLLTLVGAGGNGKTRLSLEVARQKVDDFADGVFFVPLAPLSDAALIAGAIADALKLSFQGKDAPEQQLFTFLRAKEMLLVLDNFEHILDAAAFVAELLAQAPQVKLLTTSRESLNLQAEWIYPVPGMLYPATDEIEASPLEKYSAVRLFVACARRIQPDFSLEGEQANVIHICRLVAGMPLGIELAAAWLKMLSCAEIIKEIEGSLDFLATDKRNITERHRSIRAVFDYSWDLLSTRERAVFSRLSLFRGGFDREAATAVAGASLLILATLGDKSLLRRQGDGRYEMHELLRHYAAEKLAGEPPDPASATPAEAEARRRYIDYYSRFWQQRAGDLKGGRQLAALQAIRADRENARQAWQWALAQPDWAAVDRALDGFALYLIMRGQIHEGHDTMQQALNQAAVAPTADIPALLQARLQSRLAIFAQELSLFTEARHYLAQSLAAGRAQDNPAEVAYCLYYQGYGLYRANPNQTEPDRTALLREALDVYQALGDQWSVARCLVSLGLVSTDFAERRQLFEQSLALCRQIGDQWGAARALSNLGGLATHLGRRAALLEEAVALQKQIGSRNGQCHALMHLAATAFLNGRYEASVAYNEASRRLSHEIGDSWVLGQSYTLLGNMYCLTGRYDEARPFILKALAIFRQSNWPEYIIGNLSNLARIAHYQLGDEAETDRQLQSCLPWAPAAQSPQQHAANLVRVGFAALDCGQTDLASRCFAEALALFAGSIAAHNGLGLIAYARPDGAQALAHHREALAFLKQQPADAMVSYLAPYLNVGRVGLIWTHYHLGRAYHLCGDRATAVSHLNQSIPLAYELGYLPRVLDSLLALALILDDRDRPEDSVTLLALVEQHPAGEQRLRDQAGQRLAQAAAHLPAASFTAARQQGQQMTLPQALARYSE